MLDIQIGTSRCTSAYRYAQIQRERERERERETETETVREREKETSAICVTIIPYKAVCVSASLAIMHFGNGINRFVPPRKIIGQTEFLNLR